MEATWIGGIEGGGTKFVCGVGRLADNELCHEIVIPTGSPDTTLDRVLEFFRSLKEPIAAIGLGTFGPVQLDPTSPQFGHITSTPKQGWRDFDIRTAIANALGVPVFMDTDVNAAALGEAVWGASKGVRTSLWVTVGTGVGGGLILDGRPIHGFAHTEMGHIRIPHDFVRDPYPGCCPFHGDCLEGLVSGPALQARWGASPVTFGADHPAWSLQVEYLALACINWICTVVPGRIVLSGGTIREHLLPLIQDRVADLMNGYLRAPELAEERGRYIVSSALGRRAGVLGAIALAAQSLELSPPEKS
jgi:fructokinase